MDTCPFEQSCELNDEDFTNLGTVPGYPRIQLGDRLTVDEFLEKQLVAHLLESMAHRLWWMAKQDSTSISPLHRQLVRSRKITVTEDPKLHLVWFHDRIFIKPLPEYLLSHKFWKQYLHKPQNEKQIRIRRAALGFLRTYFYLIIHPSDFRVATETQSRLIPEGITYNQFCQFSKYFAKIKEDEVTWRYAYGELRLSRLNFYVKIFGGKLYYHRTELQSGAYFARFYAPFLFLFACISLILSAMQAELGVEQVGLLAPWIDFLDLSRRFSVFTLALTLLVIVAFIGLWTFKFVKEWKFALTDRFRRKRAEHQARYEIFRSSSGLHKTATTSGGQTV